MPCGSSMRPFRTAMREPGRSRSGADGNAPWALCGSCGTVAELDLRVKPRDPEVLIPVVLNDARCPRCNNHGRSQIIGLVLHPES